MDHHSLKSLLAFLSIVPADTPVIPFRREQSAPVVSDKRKLTRGAHQMSQRERANRRKAKRRS